MCIRDRCTVIGEAFIKATAARQVADRINYGGQDPADAAAAALDDVAAHHGEGGMIVIPAHGRGVLAFNSEMMNRGWRSPDGESVQS